MIFLKKEHRTIGFDKWIKSNLLGYMVTEDCVAGLYIKKDRKHVVAFQTKIHEITLIPVTITDDIGNGCGSMITINI